MVFQSTDSVKLVLYENVSMPERQKNPTTKLWEPTGKTEELTGYTFLDGFGNKLYAVSKDAQWRTLMGQEVYVNLDVTYNDFERKLRARLYGVVPAQK